MYRILDILYIYYTRIVYIIRVLDKTKISLGTDSLPKINIYLHQKNLSLSSHFNEKSLSYFSLDHLSILSSEVPSKDGYRSLWLVMRLPSDSNSVYKFRTVSTQRQRKPYVDLIVTVSYCLPTRIVPNPTTVSSSVHSRSQNLTSSVNINIKDFKFDSFLSTLSVISLPTCYQITRTSTTG